MPETVRRILAGLVEYWASLPWSSSRARRTPCEPAIPDLPVLRFALPRPERRAAGTRSIALLVLAPRLTKPYREELRVLGAIAQHKAPEFGVCKAGWSSTRPGCWRRRSWLG